MIFFLGVIFFGIFFGGLFFFGGGGWGNYFGVGDFFWGGW